MFLQRVVGVLATRVGRSYLQIGKGYVQWEKIKTKKSDYVQIENIKTKTLQMKVFQFHT